MLSRVTWWGFLHNFSCSLERRQNELTNFSKKSHPTNNWLGYAFPFCLGTRGPRHEQVYPFFLCLGLTQCISVCGVYSVPVCIPQWIFPAQRVLKKILIFRWISPLKQGTKKILGKLFVGLIIFGKITKPSVAYSSFSECRPLICSSVGNLDSLTSKLIAAATIAPTLLWRLYLAGHFCLPPAGEKIFRLKEK